MQSSPFHRIILPALLTSSTIFAALTLPITSLQGSDRPIDLPSPLSRLVNPLLQREKEFFIRYIGLSIVVSAGAGVAMAEVLRRQHQRADRHSEMIENLNPSESEDICLTANQNDVATVALNSLDWTGGRQLHPWSPAAEQTTVPAWETPANEDFEAIDHDWSALLAEYQSTSAMPSAEPSRPSQMVEVRSKRAKLETSPTPVEPSLPAGNSDRTYRIQVAGSNQRLLAVKHQGEYYSFLRLRSTRGQAEQAVSHLRKQGKNAIFLPHERGFSIWVHQPDACLDVTPWETVQAA